MHKSKIIDCITFFDNKIDETKILELKKICNLDDLLMKDKDYVKKSISDTGKGISGGQIQKIAIARALYFSPKILILDEPTFGLGWEQKLKLRSFLRECMSQMHFIIVSHDIKFVRSICDEIIDLDRSILENNNIGTKEKPKSQRSHNK